MCVHIYWLADPYLLVLPSSLCSRPKCFNICSCCLQNITIILIWFWCFWIFKQPYSSTWNTTVNILIRYICRKYVWLVYSRSFNVIFDVYCFYFRFPLTCVSILMYLIFFKWNDCFEVLVWNICRIKLGNSYTNVILWKTNVCLTVCKVFSCDFSIFLIINPII